MKKRDEKDRAAMRSQLGAQVTFFSHYSLVLTYMTPRVTPILLHLIPLRVANILGKMARELESGEKRSGFKSP